MWPACHERRGLWLGPRRFHVQALTLPLGVTRQERFKRAMLRGVAESPFATTDTTPLIIIVGNARTPLDGCVIEVSDNKADAEEWGIDRVYKLDAQIPKSKLLLKLRVDLDAVEYQNRQYTLSRSDGDEEHSAVWIIEGTSPFKP